MAASSRSKKGSAGPGWLASLLGAIFLIVSGFLLGLVVGVVSEEPDLVVGHLTGRSTEIAWDRPSDSVIEGAVPLPGERRVAGDDAKGSEAAPAASTAVPLPSVAAPPPGHEPRSSPGRYSIQVGAFGAETGAARVAGDLRGKGYPVEVLPPTTDSRWRVRVGPVDGESAAKRMAMRLKTEEKLPTWVMQLRPR
jgi:hypothetical protein